MRGLKPRGRKRAGFSLIELLMTMMVIAILVTSAIPSMVNSRRSANETNAIEGLRGLTGAEAGYRAKNPGYGSLISLQNAGLINPGLGTAIDTNSAKSGYYYTFATPSATQYYIVAQPVTVAGWRLFYTDETGVMFYALVGDPCASG